ncbi:MAG: GDSL-type esterase/lipase family protein [Myxococcota bacterium]|nr:GDSL-type esterase/lipase family protein [Myxococcota bacterium]
MTDAVPPTSDLSRAKKLGFASITVLVALSSFEGAARLLSPPPDAAIHIEHENMITVLGLPSLNATMEYDPTLFWKLRDGLDAQLVEGDVLGQPMSFRVSTLDSLRSAPIRSSAPGLRVLALGDSCTFGLGVDDSATWPAQLQGMLESQGVDAEVINAGVPGYTAFQGLRWLETQGLALKPDVLVVIFGFNDRDFWSSRSDIDTARTLERLPWQVVAEHSRLYTGLRQLLRSRNGARKTSAAAQAESQKSAEDVVPRLAPDEFQKVLHAIAQRAADADIKLVFATWPYRAQAEKQVRHTILYQTLLEAVAGQTDTKLVDLVGPFVDGGLPLFIDHVHASVEGNRVAAQALLPAVFGD